MNLPHAPNLVFLPRRGTTLVEVLISIFVMAIGMLALLALFPLGAIRMGQTMQDGRTKATAENAAALATAMNIPFDSLVAGATGTASDSYYFPDQTPANPSGILPPIDTDASHPVFVDALGYLTAAGTSSGSWVGGYYIPRRWTSFSNTNATAVRWFGNLDDILFDTNGLAQFISASPATFQQNIEYNTAYLCKRPRANDPSLVNVSVAVYRNRPLILSGGTALPETPYVAEMDLGRANVIRVTAGANTAGFPFPPNVRVGDWLLDATPLYAYNNLGAATNQTSQGVFYKVVSVNDLDNATTEYEVHQTLRGYPMGFIGPPQTRPINTYIPAYGSTTGTIVVMEGVVEVVEKGLVRRRFP